MSSPLYEALRSRSENREVARTTADAIIRHTLERLANVPVELHSHVFSMLVTALTQAQKDAGDVRLDGARSARR